MSEERTRRLCPVCDREVDPEDAGERGVCPHDGAPLIRFGGADPMIGRTIGGRFTVERRLGSGGMGAVYAATQTSMGRAVALKVMHPRYAQSDDAARRFVREARLAATLAHPNVVAVIDFGQEPDGTLYIAMELLDGPRLDEVLAADGPLPAARAARIGLQICDALAAAQRRGIVHRDLKPANVIVVEPGAGRDVLKVVDFGLATSLDGDLSTLTRPGQIFGTPAYLSPEMIAGREVGGAADLYALGVMLHELVEGRPPFHADSLETLAIQHATASPPPLTADVPASYAVVVRRLLEKDPAARYPSADAARDALAAALEDARGAAPASEPELIPRLPRGPVGVVTTQAQVDTTAPPREPAASLPRPRSRFIGLAVIVGLLALGVGWLVAGAGTDGRDAGSGPDVVEPDVVEVDAAALTAVEADAGEGTPAAVDTAGPGVVDTVAPAAPDDTVEEGEDAAVSDEIVLRLRSTPRAAVTIDDVPRGRTPLTVKLPRRSARHVVRFSAGGYLPTVRYAAGDRDGTLRVTLDEVTFIVPP